MAIRPLGAADEERWRSLWAGYNTSYGAEVPEVVTRTTWRRLLDPASTMFCLVAETNGFVAGFANCVLHDGTWTSTASCYLEDLFVEEGSRRRGIATLLMDRLLGETARQGWSRFYWHTLATNPARSLYDRYASADAYVRYRISARRAAALGSREG